MMNENKELLVNNKRRQGTSIKMSDFLELTGSSVGSAVVLPGVC